MDRGKYINFLEKYDMDYNEIFLFDRDSMIESENSSQLRCYEPRRGFSLEEQTVRSTGAESCSPIFQEN